MQIRTIVPFVSEDNGPQLKEIKKNVHGFEARPSPAVSFVIRQSPDKAKDDVWGESLWSGCAVTQVSEPLVQTAHILSLSHHRPPSLLQACDLIPSRARSFSDGSSAKTTAMPLRRPS